MAKPNPLAQGLNQIALRGSGRAPAAEIESVAVGAAVAEAAQPVRSVPKRAPSRGGRVLVGGFFAPEVQTALKVLAAEERTTLQALLTEAINTVFAKRGRPEIAGLPPKH
ncbi:MAG: ribbon-helix-helix domain-containing protein [Rubrivivax sp.]|jgi:hypothetical protein